MDLVGFFGNKLHEKTGKQLIACSGMIRLAFKDAGLNSTTLLYEEFKKVFQKYLNNRLQKAGLTNYEDVSKYMISQLIQNQGLFTMSSE